MKNNSCVLQSKSSGRMAADSIEHPRSVPAGRGFCFQGFQSLRHPLSKAVRGRMLDDDQLPTWKCPVRHTIRIRGLFAGDFKSRGQEFWGAPVDKKRNIRRTLCGAQALQCPICFCQRDVRGASWRCTRPVLSPLGPFPPPPLHSLWEGLPSGTKPERLLVGLNPTRKNDPLRKFGVAYSAFNLQPHLIRRPTLRLFRTEAYRTWDAATAAA